MSTRARRAVSGLLRSAGRALPARREGWAEAMAAEAAWIESDPAALAFGLGCLSAALRERLRTLLQEDAPWIGAGLLAGGLFFAHALIPGSREWPLIWLLLGGGAAVLHTARADRLRSFPQAVAAALKAGVAAGGLFLTAMAGAFLLMRTPAFLGEADPLPWSRMSSLAMVAGFGALFSALGGLIVAPFACPPPGSLIEEEKP